MRFPQGRPKEECFSHPGCSHRFLHLRLAASGGLRATHHCGFPTGSPEEGCFLQLWCSLRLFTTLAAYSGL